MPPRRAGVCPECHGLGFVFVMGGEPGELPLKRLGGNWPKSRKKLCGVCGGDGQIDPEDLSRLSADPDRYVREKRKYI